MKIHKDIAAHHTFMYIWILGAVLVFGGLIYAYIGSHPQGVIDGEHEGDVRTVVAAFGNQMNSVSVLSPSAAEDLKDAYGPYVAPELLAAWIADPSSAPGRETSSPWPDHIEVSSVAPNEAGVYEVRGAIILKTSTGDAGTEPVVLTVEKRDGSFVITSYRNETDPPAAPEVTEVTVSAALAESVPVFSVTLTPVSVEEDSRCPSDVTCIQAGTVRVKTAIVSAVGQGEIVLTLGEPATTEAEIITLTDVTPYPVASMPTEDAQYRFTFKVAKR